MKKTFFLAAALIVLIAIPVSAQQTEWRFVTRLTSLDFDATTDPIFDTSTQMDSGSASLTAALELQYMVSDSVGVCLSMTSAPFDFKGKGGDLDGEDLGKIWFTPLTLTVRYEIQLRGGLQPYFGGGINAAFYLFDDVETALEDYGVTELCAGPEIGWVFEAGLNYNLSPDTFVSLDLKMMDLTGTMDLENDDADILDQVAIEGSPVEIGLGVGWRW